MYRLNNPAWKYCIFNLNQVNVLYQSPDSDFGTGFRLTQFIEKHGGTAKSAIHIHNTQVTQTPNLCVIFP